MSDTRKCGFDCSSEIISGSSNEWLWWLIIFLIIIFCCPFFFRGFESTSR